MSKGRAQRVNTRAIVRATGEPNVVAATALLGAPIFPWGTLMYSCMFIVVHTRTLRQRLCFSVYLSHSSTAIHGFIVGKLTLIYVHNELLKAPKGSMREPNVYPMKHSLCSKEMHVNCCAVVAAPSNTERAVMLHLLNPCALITIRY